ncbi:MAG: hypothetical protein ACKO24_05995 [Leptolyngbyaceae cyanobacterium]
MIYTALTSLEAWRRETAYTFKDIPVNPWPEHIALRRYSRQNVTTQRPSWQGATIGEFSDALVPLQPDDSVPAQVTAIDIAAETPAGTYSFTTASGEPVELTVLDQALPAQRLFPFYSEVGSEDCRRAYLEIKGLAAYCADEANHNDQRCWQPQGPQALKAITLARQFGIEPVKQSLVLFDNPQADIQDIIDRMNGPYGYKNMVLTGAIAPPIIWCGSINQLDRCYDPHPFFLQQINDLAPPGSIAWCADEPCVSGRGNGMDARKAIDRVHYVQTYAPRLIPMITTGKVNIPELQASAADLPILYTIVQNDDDPDLFSNQKGSYFSCMAQGNCKETDPIHPRTPFPVAVIEGDPTYDFEGAIRLAYANHARFALYYKITKRLSTCWQSGGLYNEGGNGDGTALYVDKATGDPIPSIRLLHWHRAQQAVEKEIVVRLG